MKQYDAMISVYDPETKAIARRRFKLTLNEAADTPIDIASLPSVVESEIQSIAINGKSDKLQWVQDDGVGG